jgi:hypothetical protein
MWASPWNCEISVFVGGGGVPMLHTSGLLFVLVFMLLGWWPVGWTSCCPLEWRLAYCRCVGASVLGRVCAACEGTCGSVVVLI